MSAAALSAVADERHRRHALCQRDKLLQGLFARAAGQVMPDNFNHGTAEQRQRWFNAGYQGNTIAACNTFKSTD